MGTIVGTIVSLIVGGAVASVTVIGLVNSQTGPVDHSPANINQPVIQYGSNR